MKKINLNHLVKRFSPKQKLREAEIDTRRQMWCRMGDSNTRPIHYECTALPPELIRQMNNK